MTLDRRLQVLVVGGGVGGLAAAGFLEAAGLDPVVVEADPAVDAAVGPVELHGGAVTVLSWLGLDDAVRSGGGTVHSWSLRDADSTVQRRFGGDGPPGFVAVEYGRLRAELRAALSRTVVRTDTAVRALDDSDPTVTVDFANGVTESFDAVVGADGVGSTVRDAIGGADPRSYGTTSVAFSLAHAAVSDDAVEWWAGDGAVLRVLPTDGQPWGRLTAPSRSPPDRSAAHEMLADRVAELGWLSCEALPEADDLVVRRDRRVDGGTTAGRRVALVGDAARARHRLAGVGPAAALEDAAALARAVAGAEMSVPGRIAAYASRRPEQVGPDGTDGAGSLYEMIASRVPDALQEAARLRSACLASDFDDSTGSSIDPSFPNRS